jgi:hypothetical protein
LIFLPFFHHLHFSSFLPLQKSTISFFSFFTAYLIFHLLHFLKKNPKIQKELKRTLEKRKGNVAFHFSTFGRWDKHLEDMCEWGTTGGNDWVSWPAGHYLFTFPLPLLSTSPFDLPHEILKLEVHQNSKFKLMKLSLSFFHVLRLFEFSLSCELRPIREVLHASFIACFFSSQAFVFLLPIWLTLTPRVLGTLVCVCCFRECWALTL